MRPTSRRMIHDLDATGLLCPLPVLKARKRLQSLNAGDRLRMRANDPAAIIDVPHFCAEAGHTLVESSEDGDTQIYVIEKVG
ncbi:sulfurtransferase TusA family protein [Sulfitobacter sp.]|uniref:sulfurtransferase TusA family protein n=1 Tax=Sulfitobacter sp. TaxID=1903071 RepID=UPI00300292BC